MAYFLFKTEPEEFSFEDLMREGKTIWNGVKNPLAQKFLKSVKVGDSVFIYHTGKERSIVGLAEVITGAYIFEDGYYVVDIKPLEKFQRSINLRELKKIEHFRQSLLVRMPRLSVMPIDNEGEVSPLYLHILQLFSPLFHEDINSMACRFCPANFFITLRKLLNQVF